MADEAAVDGGNGGAVLSLPYESWPRWQARFEWGSPGLLYSMGEIGWHRDRRRLAQRHCAKKLRYVAMLETDSDEDPMKF